MLRYLSSSNTLCTLVVVLFRLRKLSRTRLWYGSVLVVFRDLNHYSVWAMLSYNWARPRPVLVLHHKRASANIKAVLPDDARAKMSICVFVKLANLRQLNGGQIIGGGSVRRISPWPSKQHLSCRKCKSYAMDLPIALIELRECKMILGRLAAEFS